MPYTTPIARMTGDLITAAIWNTDIVENMKQTAPARVTAAGDWVVGTGANEVGVVNKGTNGSIVYQGATEPEFLEPGGSNAGRFIKFTDPGTGVETGEAGGMVATRNMQRGDSELSAPSDTLLLGLIWSARSPASLSTDVFRAGTGSDQTLAQNSTISFSSIPVEVDGAELFRISGSEVGAARMQADSGSLGTASRGGAAAFSSTGGSIMFSIPIFVAAGESWDLDGALFTRISDLVSVNPP